MQFPLATIDLASPRLNKRHPYELHWREERPKWPGNLDNAFHAKYSHLQDNCCCLQCGAIPCPYEHEEERKQRMCDLEFVRELAKERKELKVEVKEKEDALEDCLAQAKAWQTDKVLLKDEVNYYRKMEKEWDRQKLMLEAEVRRLQLLHEQDLEQLRAYHLDKKRLKALTKQLHALEEEYKRMGEENKRFRQMIVNQSTEVAKLTAERTTLTTELNNANSKIRVLRIQLDESRESVQTIQKNLAESESRIKNLEDEMKVMIEDIAAKTQQFLSKEKESSEIIDHLKHHMQKMHDALDESTAERDDLKRRIEEYLAEIERLRTKLANDRRFQQFVDVKREVNELRDMNESLFCKIKENPDPIPVMQKTGRVLSTSSRVMSPSTRLNRPKSSRALRPTDDNT